VNKFVSKALQPVGGGTVGGPFAGEGDGGIASEEGVKNSYSTQGVKGTPSVNVKESIVWSALTFCIPGIIYNLDKYAQINCRYATCLAKEVKNGIPASVCAGQKAYDSCNFVWNQVFNAIPWLNVYNYWVNTLQEILVNPVAAIALALGIICLPFCALEPPVTSTYAYCAIPKIFSILGQVVSDFNSKPFDTDIGGGACEDMEDARSDWEEGKEKAATGT